ncbi:hypothetical protein AWB69_04924 [Caballeronia udeis]|uniref:Lipoprotein n=1 Tax=Caballeronia udeis TaxID=1232866 RepID=A0A158HXW1_9BURK|nr:hypothetical protein AWB69_04924 [Caballeronia udeis]
MGMTGIVKPMGLLACRVKRSLPIASLVCAAVGPCLLSGCALTVVSAVDAAGSVVQAGMSIASNHSSPTFVNGDQTSLHTVCIEWNSLVPVGDFVPALQYALHKRGVESTVYGPGNSPPNCEATLVYSAATDWGHRTFTDGYTEYLSAINLTLFKHGKIVVAASYETSGAKLDRFASTTTKVTALINKMVVATSD